MQALWGLPCIQRVLVGCLGLALGIGGCASLPALPAPSGAPAFERAGGRATTDTDHELYPWTRRCPARERVRQP